MDPKLTVSDCELLIEALGRWSERSVVGSLFGAVMSGMVPDEHKDKWKADVKEMEAKEAKDASDRKRRALLLQAKLVQIGDSIRAEEMCTTKSE